MLSKAHALVAQAFHPYHLLRKRHLQARLRRLQAMRDHLIDDLAIDRLLLSEVRSEIRRTEIDLAEHLAALQEVHP